MRNRQGGFIFNVLAAFAVAFTAIICLVDFTAFFGGTKLFLEIMLAVSGLLYILSFIQSRKTYFKPGWILLQGFLFVFVSLYLFLTEDSAFVEEILRIVFGMTALTTAATQISSGIQLNTLELKQWIIPVIHGVINLFIAFVIMLGIIPFANSFIYEVSAYLLFVSANTVLEYFVRKG